MATVADTLSRALEIFYDRYQNSLDKNSRRNVDQLASIWNQLNALYDIVGTAVSENNESRAQDALDEMVAILNAEEITITIPPTPPLAIGISVSPSSIAVPTDNDGNNPDYSNAYADVQITEGQTDTTTEWSYSVGLTSNVSATITSNRVTITSLTADSGTIEILCVKDGYSELSVNVGVVRSKQGEDGTAAWSKNIDDLYYLDGNVGIGTSTPTSQLHILDSVTTELTIENSSTELVLLRLKNLDGSFRLYSSSGYFLIYDELNSKGRLVVSDSGNVGINKLPGNRLDVAGDVNIDSSYHYRINSDAIIGRGSGEYLFGLVTQPSEAKIVVTDTNQIIFRREDSLENARFDANGNLGIGTSTPNPSALLDLNSTTGTLLCPRMTTAQRDAIVNLDGGMVIFNLDTNKLQVYDSTSWRGLH